MGIIKKYYLRFVEKYKLGKTDQIVLLICVLNFVLRLPFLKLPVHGDEFAYFSGVWQTYIHNLNPFVEFWGYKPPVTFEPVAILWKIFFPSIGWGRLFIFICSSLSLWYTYLISKKFFDKKSGLYTVLLLFFFPVFMAQGLMYVDATPLTFLLLACLYYYFSNKMVMFCVFLSLMVLTKEPSVFVPFLLLFYDLFMANHRKDFKKRIIFFVIPVMLLGLWMVLNKMLLGWYLWPYNANLFNIAKIFNFDWSFHLIFEQNFVEYIFYFIFFSLVITDTKPLTCERDKYKKIILFLLICFTYVLFYSITSLLGRYLLFIYPLIFISFSYFLNKIIKKASRKNVLVGILCFVFIFINLFSSLGLSGKTADPEGADFGYFNFIYLQKQLVNYVDNNYGDYIIVSSYPFAVFFGNNNDGYTNLSRKVFNIQCDGSNLNELDKETAFFKKNRQNYIGVNTVGSCLFYMGKSDEKVIIVKVKDLVGRSYDTEIFIPNY